MALSNLNYTYNLDPNFIKKSDPNFKILVNSKINSWYGKSGINAGLKTPIPDSTMKNLVAVINNENNALVSVALQLVSLISRYIKSPAAIKSFVSSNNMKFGTTNLQWNGRTMMWYLIQNQVIIEAASIMQTQLSNRTKYKLN